METHFASIVLSAVLISSLVGCAPKAEAVSAASDVQPATGSEVLASQPLRSGNVSFGGIQVKVSVDTTKGLFQIGESVFHSPVRKTASGRIMSDSKQVGINIEDETLTATLFLDGGNGGDPQEYNCENSRIKITRNSDEGVVTELKNECAYLE